MLPTSSKCLPETRKQAPSSPNEAGQLTGIVKKSKQKQPQSSPPHSSPAESTGTCDSRAKLLSRDDGALKNHADTSAAKSDAAGAGQSAGDSSATAATGTEPTSNQCKEKVLRLVPGRKVVKRPIPRPAPLRLATSGAGESDNADVSFVSDITFARPSTAQEHTQDSSPPEQLASLESVMFIDPGATSNGKELGTSAASAAAAPNCSFILGESAVRDTGQLNSGSQKGLEASVQHDTPRRPVNGVTETLASPLVQSHLCEWRSRSQHLALDILAAHRKDQQVSDAASSTGVTNGGASFSELYRHLQQSRKASPSGSDSSSNPI